MVAAQVSPVVPPLSPNQRLKVAFHSWFFGSIAAAAILHFLVFSLWPGMTVADYGINSTELTALEIPPQVQIPPPPQDIPRPVVPVMSPNLDIDPDVTIPETRIADHPVDRLPSPPTGTGAGLTDQPVFTPHTVEPRLSRSERVRLEAFLARNYPPALRDAGIDGRVVFWVLVDETGRVANTRVVESSGYPQFDAVAREALQAVTFSPAMNRDQRVPVWVQLPIQYNVRK